MVKYYFLMDFEKYINNIQTQKSKKVADSQPTNLAFVYNCLHSVYMNVSILLAFFLDEKI